MTPAFTTQTPTTLRGRRGLTEEASTAAVDAACRRLRLPTMRPVMNDALSYADREQLSYRGLLAELLLAEVDERYRWSTSATSLHCTAPARRLW